MRCRFLVGSERPPERRVRTADPESRHEFHACTSLRPSTCPEVIDRGHHAAAFERATGPAKREDIEFDEWLQLDGSGQQSASVLCKQQQPTGAALPAEGEPGEIFTLKTMQAAPLLDSRGEAVRCNIACTTHHCFIVVDGKWACYRRNYLKIDVACSVFEPGSAVALSGDQAWFVRERGDTGSLQRVDSFSIRLTAHVADRPETEVALVQFGPARERGPRSQVEQRTLTLGGTLTSNALVNERREGVAAFRRVQIRSATLNNGQKGHSGQQYYALKITLLAHHSGSASAIAVTTSQPVTVRGRSKMHYAPPSQRNVVPFPSERAKEDAEALAPRRPFDVMDIRHVL